MTADLNATLLTGAGAAVPLQVTALPAAAGPDTGKYITAYIIHTMRGGARIS